MIKLKQVYEDHIKSKNVLNKTFEAEYSEFAVNLYKKYEKQFEAEIEKRTSRMEENHIYLDLKTVAIVMTNRVEKPLKFQTEINYLGKDGVFADWREDYFVKLEHAYKDVYVFGEKSTPELFESITYLHRIFRYLTKGYGTVTQYVYPELKYEIQYD
jgi:hypothetical protein